jgi:hypothetical protein
MDVIVLVTAMLIAMKAPNCCAFTVEYQDLQCSTVTPIHCNLEINRNRLIHLYIVSLILFTTILLRSLHHAWRSCPSLSDEGEA